MKKNRIQERDPETNLWSKRKKLEGTLMQNKQSEGPFKNVEKSDWDINGYYDLRRR